MADVKDDAIKEILTYKPIKIIVLIMLVILLAVSLFSFFHHLYRCNKGLNSNLFWGLEICQECKTIDSIKHDTLYVLKHDTVNVAKSMTQNRGDTHQTKPTDTTKSHNKFDLHDSQFHGPTQIGDGNTQNNQFGLKPREVTDSLLNAILSPIPSLKVGINIWHRSNDPESLEFANKLSIALKNRGCSHIIMNGQVMDQILGGDPAENARIQKQMKIEWNGSQMHIVIPANN